MTNDTGADALIEVPGATEEPVSDERALAYELWQRGQEMDEYSDDGAVLRWMKDPPDPTTVQKWTSDGVPYYYVIFPDNDGRFHANISVFICKPLSYDFYKKLAKKNLDQLQSMEHVLSECTLFPQISPSDLIKGNLPSGIVYTLYRRIQDASMWQDSTLISKN